MIIRLLVVALVAFGLSKVLSGIHIDTYWSAVVFALVLSLANFIVRPIMVILTIPITILTLGLFLFVINSLMVLLAAKIVSGIAVNGFWWALLFSILLSFITSLLFSSKKE